MFSCIGICINRRKNFINNLKQQNTQIFEYQPSNFAINTKQQQLQPTTQNVGLQTRPLFKVNENITFVDYYTKKECHIIQTSSLPDHFNYFIPAYTSEKPLLCLDLDETLIASQPRSTTTANFQIQVTVANNEHTYYVTKRPHLDEFLLSLAEVFELAIFTYSIKPYADKILKIIDPHGLIKYRFYREHCVKQQINEQQFVITKDLTRVGVCLDKILLVDNAKRAGEWQPNNFILVEDFFGNQEDDVLKKLEPRVKALGTVPSIYKELENAALE
uniref:Mitochondrial import inner membrane translocase subunit TIM50 n=1 Tax=Trepomonas sp. PC1 TaxID=1076344 RepID=A0A146KFC9_9EUKA|eukprot:JAP94131.1 Nuclear LIM interactor-interacting factor [Trepomonas sp. PC1]